MQFYKEDTDEEMAITLAHEVKNPVSLIKANIELLEISYDFSSHAKNINVIKKELNKISEIMNEFVSIHKENYNENIEKVNLIKIIEENIEKFSISNNKINFYFNDICNMNSLNLKANYNKMCILFSNIYKNAIEAIPNFGNIETTIYQKEKNLIITVKDDGTGIPEDIKNSISKPFFTSKKDGNGVGISICKNILEEINATIEINNNETKGCTVNLIFKTSSFI